MKITHVETIPVDRYLFVQVSTDSGLVGLGEAGTWGFLEAGQAANMVVGPPTFANGPEVTTCNQGAGRSGPAAATTLCFNKRSKIAFSPARPCRHRGPWSARGLYSQM
jgi:L-alanine-DL-glutamate epimerase-like enolase superfamily enzyme